MPSTLNSVDLFNLCNLIFITFVKRIKNGVLEEKFNFTCIAETLCKVVIGLPETQFGTNFGASTSNEYYSTSGYAVHCFHLQFV